MHLTNHASIRSQQRSIPPLMIDLLIQFGAQEKSGAGTTKYYFNGASRRKVLAYAGTIARVIEEHLDFYAVVDAANSVVTVAHRTERIKRH